MQIVITVDIDAVGKAAVASVATVDAAVDERQGKWIGDVFTSAVAHAYERIAADVMEERQLARALRRTR
jgi:DNA-binding protein YbaB